MTSVSPATGLFRSVEGHHLLVMDAGDRDRPGSGAGCSASASGTKLLSAKGRQWLLFSFQTFIWLSCFPFFLRFVFQVLAETLVGMDSVDPGLETPLTVSCLMVNGNSPMTFTFPSISLLPSNGTSPAEPWAQAKRKPPCTESQMQWGVRRDAKR